MLLIFDNYDSFTYNLCDYFKQLGQELIIIRNDEKSLDEIELLQFSAIVISPGPGIPQNSGILLSLIERWHKRVPILGICLGHQALGIFFGLSLVNAPYPMHGKVSTLTTLLHTMWNDIANEIKVCRYHSLVLENHDLSQNNANCHNQKIHSHLENLSDEECLNNYETPITITAYSKDDHCIMALAHKTLPIWGIQFHPEAILSQYGIQILDNWLKAFTLHKQ